MALDMCLELEGNSPDWAACLEAARRTGVSHLDEKNGKLIDGTFARSAVYFWRGAGGEERAPQPISAEGYHGCDFLTQYVLCFRMNTGRYDESVEDIKAFLTHLSQLSLMQFVLSFQGEDVYAVRCSSGFEWFWAEPRDANWKAPS